MSLIAGRSAVVDRDGIRLSRDATHYLWGNGDGSAPRRLVRVTDVLGHFFPLKGDPEVLAFAADRGRAVHRAIELLVGGGDGSGLDQSDVDRLDAKHPGLNLRPRVDAFTRFQRDSGVKIITEDGIEAPVFSLVHGFGGRFDFLATNLGRHRSRLALVDVKSGEPRPSHQLQLGAYALAFKECRQYRGAIGRWILYLRDNGSFQLEECTDPQDERVFLACLTLYRWSERNAKH